MHRSSRSVAAAAAALLWLGTMLPAAAAGSAGPSGRGGGASGSGSIVPAMGVPRSMSGFPQTATGGLSLRTAGAAAPVQLQPWSGDRKLRRPQPRDFGYTKPVLDCGNQILVGSGPFFALRAYGGAHCSSYFQPSWYPYGGVSGFGLQ
ncbi:MAG: hypothetical protein WB615_02710 [Candidatus Tumulicola sp.]